MAPDYSQRKYALQRWAALLSERSSWDATYLQISRYVLPFAGRFYHSDRNWGNKTYDAIIDNTPTRASGILAAGMMGGNSSPARPWFRVTTQDPQLADRDNVKLWFSIVAEIMREIFSQSNTYRALHSMYEQLGVFGTATNILDDNYDSMIWNTPLTIGQFCIGADEFGRANTLFRQYEKPLSQVVARFVQTNPKSGSLDWSNASQTLKNLWDQNKFDTWVPLMHAIQPREMANREYGKPGAKNMPFSSCYYELNASEEKILHESGYKTFPVLAPRWHTYGSDIMGVGPGHVALGDVKQLQHEQLRKTQGIDYQSLPPVAVPAEFKGREIDTLPGGVSALGISANGKIQNLFDVKLDLGALLEDIQDVRGRINSAFFADLFLMLVNNPSVQPVTATEIAEKKEEKLLMLGPVLERLNDEMLSPLIVHTFARMVATGVLPPAPPELHNADIKVEFVSVLAQAQRAVGLASIDKLIGTVMVMSQGKQDPSVWDKVDTDKAIDKYSDMLAVDPELIVADDKVALIRKGRAQQQQAQQAAQAAPLAAQAMKNAAQAHQASPGMTEQLMGYS